MKITQNNSELPATKKDLVREVSKLASRNELAREIKKLATKEELTEAVKKLATKEELAQLEKILRTEIRLTAEETREGIKEEVSQSSSKVLNVLDEFLKELEASRDERAISADQQVKTFNKLENHELRIAALEGQKYPAPP